MDDLRALDARIAGLLGIKVEQVEEEYAHLKKLVGRETGGDTVHGAGETSGQTAGA
jgi:hypothetical protein